jgi:hypothetical protein
MAQSGGQPLPGPVFTREVRWFFDGLLPSEVKNWFTAFATRGERELRTDVYDRVEARRGVGVKRRNGATVDIKTRRSHFDDVYLMRGVVGCVEDWEKNSRSRLVVGPDQILVSKDIVTLRFDLDRSKYNDPTGCEAELASIRVGPKRAWSLCFETYGDPDRRAEALSAGVERLFAEGPPPEALYLEAEFSCGYPQWIRSLESVVN